VVQPAAGTGLGGFHGQCCKLELFLPMRKTFYCIPALMLAGSCLMAQDGDKLLLHLSSGYERQDFRWSIAGNSAGQDPNIYSELKWHAISGPAGKADLQWKPCGRWRVFASGSRVWSRTGTISDTDYGLDNRNDPIYHAQFNVTGGYSETGSAGIGFCIPVSGPFHLTPFIGYGIHMQYFPIADPGGPYAQLNSSYSAKWLGPLIKADLSWQLSGRWQLAVKGEYDQLLYRASADWNLIQEFSHPVSFRDHADGYGVEGEFSLHYMAGRHIGVMLAADYFNRETGTGIDVLYLNTGQAPQTQLNGVYTNGFGVRLGMDLRF
jgi:outer membrane protein Pom